MRMQSQEGFTLLEVLVATAILGAAVVALLGLTSGALSNARNLAAPQRAAQLAHSQMNELMAQGQQSLGPEPGRTVEGRWDEQFRWEARTVADRLAATRSAREIFPVRVVLDVFWKTSAGDERKLTLETVQLWQEPAGNAGNGVAP